MRNKTIIEATGNVGANVFSGTSEGGVSYLKFTVLTENMIRDPKTGKPVHSYTDEEGAEHKNPPTATQFTYFGKVAEDNMDAITKGTRVCCTGRLKGAETYERKDGSIGAKVCAMGSKLTVISQPKPAQEAVETAEAPAEMTAEA